VNGVEIVEHVIMYCERYKEDRDTLFEEIQRKEETDITLRIILKPERENDNGEALFGYLENTGLIDRI